LCIHHFRVIIHHCIFIFKRDTVARKVKKAKGTEIWKGWERNTGEREASTRNYLLNLNGIFTIAYTYLKVSIQF
jgi:thymidylate synthase